MARLFIICGHGAGDPGAIGNGYQEWERVRALAKKIKELGGDNVMIGDMNRDWFRENLIRTLTIPKDWELLELHMDYATPTAMGAHVIIKAGLTPDNYDRALASFITGVFPGRSNSIVGRNNLSNPYAAFERGYSYRLLECGFITNAYDVNKFNTKMSEIAMGILGAFGITGNSVSYTPQWIKDNGGWWYRYSDGSYPKNKWVKLDSWYYFNEHGYAISNRWEKIDGLWYKFGPDCRMKTGWVLDNGFWYYLATRNSGNVKEGSMITGRQSIDGKIYYLYPETSGKNPEGSMATGLIEFDDSVCVFETSGELKIEIALNGSKIKEINEKKYEIVK